MPRQRLDLRESLTEADYDTRNAAIADDQVRAEAERHDRRAFLQPGKKRQQVVKIFGFEQPVGRAAALEPDQLGQRRVAGELAADVAAREPGRRQRALGLRRASPATQMFVGLAAHAARSRLPAIAAASPAAHLVMSPAPRQTTKSPGLITCASSPASSSGPEISHAERCPLA